MKFETVDCHSFAPELLSGLPVLDVGCRGFRFSNHFAKLGHVVVAMDPDPTMDMELALDSHARPLKGVMYRRALVPPSWPRKARLVMTPDPEARFVAQDTRAEAMPIECMSLPEVMQASHVTEWDLVKLNCEGTEFDILWELHAPVARQIVVSFHEHCHPRGDAAIRTLIEHLSQWYLPIRHDKDARYGAGMNWWDSVLARRDIAC